MPGLVPGIHVSGFCKVQDVDGRNKSGHDKNKNQARSAGLQALALAVEVVGDERLDDLVDRDIRGDTARSRPVRQCGAGPAVDDLMNSRSGRTMAGSRITTSCCVCAS